MNELGKYFENHAKFEADKLLEDRFVAKAFPQTYFPQFYTERAKSSSKNTNEQSALEKEFPQTQYHLQDGSSNVENEIMNREAKSANSETFDHLRLLWRGLSQEEKKLWQQKLDEQLPLWNITFRPHRSVRAMARAWTKEAAIAEAAKTIHIDMADRDHYRIRESFTGFRLHIPNITIENAFINNIFWNNHKHDKEKILRKIFLESEASHQQNSLRAKTRSATDEESNSLFLDPAEWILNDGGSVGINREHIVERWERMSESERESLRHLYNVPVRNFTYV